MKDFHQQWHLADSHQQLLMDGNANQLSSYEYDYGKLYIGVYVAHTQT